VHISFSALKFSCPELGLCVVTLSSFSTWILTCNKTLKKATVLFFSIYMLLTDLGLWVQVSHQIIAYVEKGNCCGMISVSSIIFIVQALVLLFCSRHGFAQFSPVPFL
jgi:hypothetical protein